MAHLKLARQVQVQVGLLQASLLIARHDVSNKAAPLAFVTRGFFADFEPFLFPLLVCHAGGGGGFDVL